MDLERDPQLSSVAIGKVGSVLQQANIQDAMKLLAGKGFDVIGVRDILTDKELMDVADLVRRGVLHAPTFITFLKNSGLIPTPSPSSGKVFNLKPPQKIQVAAAKLQDAVEKAGEVCVASAENKARCAKVIARTLGVPDDDAVKIVEHNSKIAGVIIYGNLWRCRFNTSASGCETMELKELIRSSTGLQTRGLVEDIPSEAVAEGESGGPLVAAEISADEAKSLFSAEASARRAESAYRDVEHDPASASVEAVGGSMPSEFVPEFTSVPAAGSDVQAIIPTLSIEHARGAGGPVEDEDLSYLFKEFHPSPEEELEYSSSFPVQSGANLEAIIGATGIDVLAPRAPGVGISGSSRPEPQPCDIPLAKCTPLPLGSAAGFSIPSFTNVPAPTAESVAQLMARRAAYLRGEPPSKREVRTPSRERADRPKKADRPRHQPVAKAKKQRIEPARIDESEPDDEPPLLIRLDSDDESSQGKETPSGRMQESEVITGSNLTQRLMSPASSTTLAGKSTSTGETAPSAEESSLQSEEYTD